MNIEIQDLSNVTSTDGSTPYYYGGNSSNNFEGDASWYDADYQKDRETLEDYAYPLENDDPVPCDSCPFANQCRVSGKECVAFRSWIVDGKSTKTSDLGRLLR